MAEESVYQMNGYDDRDDYLAQMADEYGVDEETVIALAEMLGPDEDFDGLVSALKDIN